MRHLLSTGSFVIVAAMGVPFAVASDTSFPDVPETHPEAWAIEELHSLYAVGGFEDGTFRPDAPATRAGVVQVAMQASGRVGYVLGPSEKPSYTDIAVTDPALGFIERAVREGVLKPQGEKPTFRPQAAATRAEGLKLVLTAFGLTPPNVAYLPFADVKADAWEAPYVAFAVQHDLIRTTGSAFGPATPLRRAELARITARLIDAQRDANRPLLPLAPVLGLIGGWLLLGAPLARSWVGGARTFGARVTLFTAALLLGPLAMLLLLSLRLWKRRDTSTLPAQSRQPARRRRSAFIQRTLLWLDASLVDVLGITVTVCYLVVLTTVVQTSLSTLALRSSLPPFLHG